MNDRPTITVTGDGNVIGDRSHATTQSAAANVDVQVTSDGYDTGQIRAMLMECFSSEELRTVLFDNFRPVYEDTPPAEAKQTLVQRLIEYATRHDLLGKLLLILQRINPDAFAMFPLVLTRK